MLNKTTHTHQSVDHVIKKKQTKNTFNIRSSMRRKPRAQGMLVLLYLHGKWKLISGRNSAENCGPQASAGSVWGIIYNVHRMKKISTESELCQDLACSCKIWCIYTPLFLSTSWVLSGSLLVQLVALCEHHIKLPNEERELWQRCVFTLVQAWGPALELQYTAE